MEPIQSYRIWFTQRSGSTLLCKSLESTNVAGRPGEFFNITSDSSFCQHYQVNNYTALKEKLWLLGSTDNRVFGIKHSLHRTIYNRLFSEILRLRNINDKHPNHQTIWADLFPNCKHIYLTRRNKIRQAVSWWKAIQDDVWHIESGGQRKQTDEFYAEKYDVDALQHLFKETVLKEASIQAYFSKYNIVPLTIVYEDFIRDYEATIQRIIDHLEIKDQAAPLAPMFFQPTANQHSEDWVERFRKDLQKDWKDIVW